MKCINCNSELSGRQTKYCSPKCRNQQLQAYEAQKRRGLDRKMQFVSELGGKFSRCGYSENLAALVFHHTEEDEKDFQLDMRSLSNRTIQKCQEELKKCDLLCSNCHMEIHHPHLKLSTLLSS